MEHLDEITENLWLGDMTAAKDVSKLISNGFEKVLSVMDQDGPNYGNDNIFNHKKIIIKDFISQNIIQYFGECLNFIDGEEKVLVHCMAGASRSATIVIAYLMWKKKMKYNDALVFTQKKRFIVDPNDGFKDQLKMFEKLLEENDYDISKIKFKEIKWDPKEEDYDFFI